MKYFPSNPIIEKQIKDIRQSIRLGMNGITSDSMKKAGIKYKLNYGVSIPYLKQIASNYQQNGELAQRLWALKIRETMILATLLHPIDSFTQNMADEWLCECATTEMVELLCMNLVSKLRFAPEKAIEWIENEKTKPAGFILAARIATNFSMSQVTLIIEKAIHSSNTQSFPLYNAIALCLRYIARRNENEAQLVQQKIQFFEHSNTTSQKYIYQEVSNEIFYYSKIK
jgi:3-methyladenine DNA glycosylase AlkD